MFSKVGDARKNSNRSTKEMESGPLLITCSIESTSCRIPANYLASTPSVSFPAHFSSMHPSVSISFILQYLLIPIHSLNVLFYVPTLSHSHIAFNSKLAEVLSSFGHSVTVLLVQVDDTLLIANATDYTVLRKQVGVPHGHLREVLWSNPGPYEDSSPLNPHIFYKLLKVSRTFVTACESEK